MEVRRTRWHVCIVFALGLFWIRKFCCDLIVLYQVFIAQIVAKTFRRFTDLLKFNEIIKFVCHPPLSLNIVILFKIAILCRAPIDKQGRNHFCFFFILYKLTRGGTFCLF